MGTNSKPFFLIEARGEKEPQDGGTSPCKASWDRDLRWELFGFLQISAGALSREALLNLHHSEVVMNYVEETLGHLIACFLHALALLQGTGMCKVRVLSLLSARY